MTSKHAKTILTAIYNYHNPDKIKSIEQLLTKYRGNEDELINSIFKKYAISETARAMYLNLPEPVNIDATQKAESSVVEEDNLNLSEPVNIGAIQKKRRGKIFFTITFAVIIIILSIIAYYTYVNPNIDNEAQNKENGRITPPADTINKTITSAPSNFLSLDNFKTIVNLNEWNPNQIENLLNIHNGGWKYTGKANNDPDDYQLGWSQGNLSVLFYHINKVIWEYIYKDPKEAQALERDMINNNFKMYSTNSDNNSETKIYKDGTYVIEMVQVRMTSGDYAYKFLIGNGNNMAHGLSPKINLTSLDNDKQSQSPPTNPHILKTLEEIADLNAWDENKIIAELNQISHKWEYEGDNGGKDKEISAYNWVAVVSPEHEDDLTFSTDSLTWEYTFFDIEQWKQINNDINTEGFKLKKDGELWGIKTFTNTNYFIQTRITGGTIGNIIYVVTIGNMEKIHGKILPVITHKEL